MMAQTATGLLRPPRKYTPSETTQIYTDWANHYLEKVKSKRRIQDLPNDVTDGVILADVIEAVANQKLPDVNRKPKTGSQMIDNIATCLRLLTALGIPLDDVTASDIHQGNLKSILTVFFALSRYKQQQKSKLQQQQQQEMAKIPIAKTNGSSIPAVAPIKKIGQMQMISKIAVPSSVHYGSPQLRPISSTATSAASSRSASPSLCSTGSGNLSSTGSLIPRTPTKTSSAASKITSIKTPVAAHPTQKQSMLDKFKLFKPNEKSAGIPTALSKRPSSSSGFSSGRSEQSDVSFSSNGHGSAPLTTLAVFDQPPMKKTVANSSHVVQNGTKERSIRTRAKNSPKLSPKVKRVAETGEEMSNKVNEQVTMPAKPFCSGSGIPKPTAAVKGTAKVVKKPTVTGETTVLERTPGDGKEVSTASNKNGLSDKSEMVDPSLDSVPPLHDSNLAGNSLTALSSQVAVKCKSGTDSPTRSICLPTIADKSEPSSQPPTVLRSQNQPGQQHADTEELVHQLEKPQHDNMLVDLKGPESDQPEECKADSCAPPVTRSTNSFVAKVLPMTSADLDKNPSGDMVNGGDPTNQCQDDDEDESMNIQPMTIFPANKSLGKRHDFQNGSGQSFHESPTTVKRAVNTSYADPLDGYLSEGGASLYARKLHYLAVTQRNKDDDSYDDSSSLSSGISDPWTEVYGLHFKMEHNGVYPGIPSGYGTPLQNRRHPPAVAETSPYKQISSSQWKKFIEAGRLPSSSERFQTELWKGDIRERSRSQQQQQEVTSPRKTEHKKLNTIESGKRSKVYTESETGERRQPAKGVPASFGYVKKSVGYPGLDVKRSDPSVNGKGITYKTANVATVPKLMEEQRENVPASSNRSLERPKTRLKVSGGTQTDLGGRTLKPSQYKSPPTSTPAQLTGQQPCGSFSDSEYQTTNGGKFTGPMAPPNTSPTGKTHQQPGFKSYSLTAPIANQLSHNIRERLLLNGTQSLPKSHFNQIHARGMEEKRLAHANFAAHLFAGVSELNGETDLNLDSPGASQSGDKLRDKDKSIKYVVNGRNMHTDGSLSDTPYTAYWNKYHPKNNNDLATNPDSLDSATVHGPKLTWLNNPPSPRLNRSNSVRSTKSEKVYPSMLQRNEEGELNNFGNHPQENGADVTNSHRYAGSTSGVHPTSRSSLGNYSALLSLSRMNSKEEDCHGSSLSLVSTASSLYSSQEEKQASEIRKLRRELAEAHEKVNTLSGQLSTNAHVVAAFEQSLASMTSRLQSLTMTAEHKENELQDLRHFVEQIRKSGVEAGIVSKNDMQSSHPLMSRQLSSDSVSSVTSQATNLSSVSSVSPNQPPGSCSPSPSPSLKKKSWLRNSFSKAFSRSKRPQGGSRQGTGSDSEDSSGPVRGNGSTWSAPSSPMLASHHPHHHTDMADDVDRSIAIPETVQDLKKQLREKEMVLTDIRLEALSSAHQLEALKETVARMRNEMLTLKQDNERLQRQVEHHSAVSSPHHTVDRRASHRRSPADEASVITDWMLGLDNDKDSKSIAVHLHIKQDDEVGTLAVDNTNLWLIGYVAVSGKTRWDHLDHSVCKLFNEYLRHVDPQSHLGLDEECLSCYRVGEIERSMTTDESITPPELLPCGYLVGDCNYIALIVKQNSKYDLPACLALDTLIPLPILSRYVSLLSEHGRVILCGPSGTGKSYFARKLAEYSIAKDEKMLSATSITTMKIDASSCKEVKQYLSHVCETLLSGDVSEIPSVIILEDLHLATSLCDIFSPLSHFDSVKENQKFPYLIGTTGPMAQSSVNLQLQFNFRWILLANHVEPVQGLIQRYLRRRLIQSELVAKSRDGALERVVEWIPRCWAHLNKFLETHNSADVTIGPRWFLQVPADATCSQIWFTDLWNYTLGPYLLHAAKEGLQLYGKRAPWEDPTLWILSTYPWAQGSACDALMRLRPEDVGYDTATRPNSSNATDQDRDPLVNMLIKLQEAAGLPSPVDNSENSSESLASGNESKTTDSL